MRNIHETVWYTSIPSKLSSVFYPTVNAPLQEVVNAVVTLELTAAGITGNPSDICDVTVGSHLYQFNKSTLLVSTVVDCPDGSVPSEGLCGTVLRVISCFPAACYVQHVFVTSL